MVNSFLGCGITEAVAWAMTMALLLQVGSATAQEQPGAPESYEPTVESVDQHPVPEWFDDAKLGIFINWGLYSVPGWAPTSAGELGEVDDSTWFANNSYAEWYWNTMRIDDSPGQRYHRETYGESFTYDDFAPIFKDTIEGWTPQGWADLFRQVGARYVVFDTKHHDGFLLWPSKHPNPNKEKWQVERDLVGELGRAVRDRGMRFGLYYSGGIDWSFSPVTVTRMADLEKAVPQSQTYAEYATAHWRELIDRYQPAVLWNDISFPRQAPLLDLFADYYNRIPDGVINDRWASFQELSERLASEGSVEREALPYDFSTPEYQVYGAITPKKWEATRGLGLSFGYNKNTKEENMLTVDELVDTFVDIVSKNGNLLLNIGPKADGTIPELQAERLRGLGNWLSTNGEAVFGTRPWVEAEGVTRTGIDVRFTEKDGAVYATLLSTPDGSQVVIEDLFVEDGGAVRLLGRDETLSWDRRGPDIVIQWPGDVASAPAHVLKITPQPWRLNQK